MAVFQQIPELGVLVLAHSGLERHRTGYPHQGEAHGFFTQPQFACQVAHRGDPSLIGGDLLLHFFDAVQLLGDVHRQSDRSALGGDGSCDALANPPVGVGAEAEAAGGVEFFHRSFQPQGAFLHQVKQFQASLLIFLGHRHHQAQVGLDHPIASPASFTQAFLQFPAFQFAVV